MSFAYLLYCPNLSSTCDWKWCGRDGLIFFPCPYESKRQSWQTQTAGVLNTSSGQFLETCRDTCFLLEKHILATGSMTLLEGDLRHDCFDFPEFSQIWQSDVRDETYGHCQLVFQQSAVKQIFFGEEAEADNKVFMSRGGFHSSSGTTNHYVVEMMLLCCLGR